MIPTSAEVIFPMGVDNDDDIHSLTPGRGKNVFVSGKATPWVEKYQPRSLADVASHRHDIVDTKILGDALTGLAARIGCHNMILELNSSDDRGTSATAEFDFWVPRCCFHKCSIYISFFRKVVIEQG